MMVRGAVAMIDALGFKGIWSRKKPADVMVALKTAQVVLAQIREKTIEIGADRGVASVVSVDTLCISDTIVVGVTARSSDEIPAAHRAHAADMMATHTAAMIVALTIRFALEADVPLGYRGCISLGDFAIDGSFMIGPAVDEAASNYELAEGAFVWLTPSAKAAGLSLTVDESKIVAGKKQIPVLLHPWTVPLKAGRSYRTCAVVPFATLPGESRKQVSDRLLATFGEAPSLDVDIKKSNTASFLDDALGECAKFEAIAAAISESAPT